MEIIELEGQISRQLCQNAIDHKRIFSPQEKFGSSEGIPETYRKNGRKKTAGETQGKD